MTDGKDFLKYPAKTKKGFMEAHEGDGVVTGRPHVARGTVQKESVPTITTGTGGGCGVVVKDENIKLADRMNDTDVEQAKRVYDTDGNAPTLTTGGTGSIPKIEVVGDLNRGGYERDNRVHSTEGISPCIANASGIDHTPKIEIVPEMKEGDVCPMLTPGRENKRQNGRRFKEPDEPAFTVTTQDQHGIAYYESLKPIEKTMNLLITIDMVCDIVEEKKGNAREILPDVRKEDGKADVWYEIRGFGGIQKEEVLQSGMYEDRIFEDGEREPWKNKLTQYIQSGKCPDNETNVLCYMWQYEKYRCASQGWGLDEQYAREFDSIVQKLSHERASSEKCLQNMWKTDGWGTRLLQQTLSSLQKIWQSVLCQNQTKEILQNMWEASRSKRTLFQTLSTREEESENQTALRIRYLTEREAWRLQGFDDARIDKAFAQEKSKTQRYKMAGNSIAVPVLEAIFKGIYIDRTYEKPKTKQTRLGDEQ